MIKPHPTIRHQPSEKGIEQDREFALFFDRVRSEKFLARRSVLLLPLFAIACSDDGPDTRSYAIPSYSYLTPIRLNVASIEISDRSPPPGPNALDGLSPLRPADALKTMASDRLFADGSAGRAVFVIDQARITRANGGIDGLLAVHLDVFAGTGDQRAGYAEARVARRRTSTNSSEDPRAVLYDFVVQMMNDMNVEFEYQVRRSLRDWVQTTVGAAPLPPPVHAQDLATPGPPAVTTLPSAAAASPAFAPPTNLAPTGGVPPNPPPGAPSNGQFLRQPDSPLRGY